MSVCSNKDLSPSSRRHDFLNQPNYTMCLVIVTMRRIVASRNTPIIYALQKLVSNILIIQTVSIHLPRIVQNMIN